MHDVGSDTDVGRDSSVGVDTGRDSGAVVHARRRIKITVKPKATDFQAF